ncbi:hypothetical protein EVAR_804_1 [Eumeta japonica]|uniref:Uncharacterized protein n=1 Tax=Eumeta variegata TaxID=151549 RepID=A0A4C1SC96_EUMVA|nr:hypothetical protein EVAR_804_1 [Eumeta japonica]
MMRNPIANRIFCSFEPRSVVSGSARVRVCGVPRSVSRAAAVKPRASVPARSSGYPAVCTPSPHTVSAPRVRSSSFHTPMPIAILVISRVFTRVIGFSINCVSATACGPAAALWGRASLSVTASGQTLLVMVNPFRIKFNPTIATTVKQSGGFDAHAFEIIHAYIGDTIDVSLKGLIRGVTSAHQME